MGKKNLTTKQTHKQKILFILKNKNEASSRFRVEAYFPYLKNDFDYAVFYSEYNNRSVAKIFRSFIKRIRFIRLLFQVRRYDIVFMQRPMSSDKKKSVFFEKLLTLFNKNLVFDFDDALFVQNPVKISNLIKLSKKVICGNDYLASYAKRYNPNTFVVPTAIDTQKFFPLQKKQTDKLTIGWTGTSGNYANFSQELIKALKQILQKRSNVEFLFICDKRPPAHFTFPYRFIQWSEKSELEDLRQIDIGIMPLVDSEWTRGKCGFKLIQYGAIGIPSVASNVGVNGDVVLHEKSGYLIFHQEWHERLEALLNDEDLRRTFGKTARAHIESNYSLKATYPLLKKYITRT